MFQWRPPRVVCGQGFVWISSGKGTGITDILRDISQPFQQISEVVLQQEQVDGTYVYRHKHNYIPYSTFTITKVQLHVSAINVGHLQVVHVALNDKLYLHVSGEFTVCGVAWVRDLVLCL